MKSRRPVNSTVGHAQGERFMAEPPVYILEQRKAWSEYIKHLTTLSTGSLILLAAFLEKLFPQPMWKGLVVVALCGFTISIIASVIGYSLLVINFPGVAKPADSDGNIWATAIIVALSCFILSIVSLGAFAIKNLLR